MKGNEHTVNSVVKALAKVCMILKSLFSFFFFFFFEHLRVGQSYSSFFEFIPHKISMMSQSKERPSA